ncbi:MacB family efflux pump subunit [Catenovulum sp. 2E275]|uniref:MacB family efflux pump subunit n=1 Tax=Catenovulum sp. 2E275 TaxID=2980497 RepID=UPI0021D07902|nr:MacB family efflux pump subunit [Catenovulum sp. 2E275]MCU4675859.1 MacB family efflux pump subunit [Catenovulum sp. 2E275]
MSQSMPLLELKNVCRYYSSNDIEVKALDQINLTIERGEFVAIMGQSGSGKSTLMNILGCLDKPTSGEYFINGQSVASLNADCLSALRLKTFGFVFQRYQLLSNYTAQENVAMPAIYAGIDKNERFAKADELLAKLGLEDRGLHKPTELSGGQQQRVSVARALINGAEVILADEPTGALDSASGEQLLALLKQLNQEGVTVILITHDPEVAEHADRLIQVKDGVILSDSQDQQAQAETQQNRTAKSPIRALPGIATLESIVMAFTALHANWFRTLLTLLGIIIGVASVVTMMAIGEGGKQQVLKRIEAIGTNLILVIPGGANIRSTGENASLSLEDADAISQIDGILYTAPERSTRATIRHGQYDFRGRIKGTNSDYKGTKDWEMAKGVFFTDDDLKNFAPVVVIGSTVADQLFPNGEEPIGKYVLMQSAFYQVIGVLQAKGATAGGNDMDDEVLIPITTGQLKAFGRSFLNSILVKVEETDKVDQVTEAIKAKLIARHGQEDFMIRTTESLVETISETQDTLTWLLASVAGISLFVGGIGVMNIMLVNVSERRREIGLRIATGAKPRDILKQFNIEAWVVCILGGLIGIAFGFITSLILMGFDIPIAFTMMPPVLAFITSLLVGLVFGYAPAHKAAKLNPIQALAED